MSDIINGFRSGEKEKKSWKDRLLEQVHENPLGFILGTFAIGIAAMYTLGYFLDIETAKTVHTPASRDNLDLGHWSDSYEWHSPYRK